MQFRKQIYLNKEFFFNLGKTKFINTLINEKTKIWTIFKYVLWEKYIHNNIVREMHYI